jgi:hypothetical protein
MRILIKLSDPMQSQLVDCIGKTMLKSLRTLTVCQPWFGAIASTRSAPSL